MSKLYVLMQRLILKRYLLPQNVQGKIIKIIIGLAQKIKLLIHTHEHNIAREQEKKT